jgi:hypothetical protein
MKQFCKKGHDTFVVGRNGLTCKGCSRVASREWARRNKSSVKEKASSLRGRFSLLRGHSQFTGKECTLTFEQYSYFLSEKCFVTGCCDRVSGLDRIDSSIGYTFVNVRPSCERHNEMKNNMTDEETYKKAKEFVTWWEQSSSSPA